MCVYIYASGNMFRLGNIESYNMGNIGNIGSIGKYYKVIVR